MLGIAKDKRIVIITMTSETVNNGESIVQGNKRTKSGINFVIIVIVFKTIIRKEEVSS